VLRQVSFERSGPSSTQAGDSTFSFRTSTAFVRFYNISLSLGTGGMTGGGFVNCALDHAFGNIANSTDNQEEKARSDTRGSYT
jgi:hypothetical protein